MLIGVAMFGAVITNIYVSAHYEINGLGSVSGAAGLVGFMAAASVTAIVAPGGGGSTRCPRSAAPAGK